ncbi:MAG: tol-pal system protein YbgF [Acidobacteria bacterium]|nr:MAG: tol-pal system protein YbgF [Acidobacteriota bacterium]
MKKSVYLILLSGLLAVGCTSSTQGTRDYSSAEMDEIKRRVMELQENATVAQVELERLRQQVANLEAALRDLDQRRAGGVEISEAVSPYGSIIGVEETDLPPVQVPQPATGVGQEGAASIPEEGSSGDPVVGYRPVEPAAQALYDRGYSLFHQGRYLDAEATFQRFLQAYADTDLSDNAQYWIGECRYARQDLRGALAAFRETVQRYPAGNKVPDAMIKEGDCLRGLGDLEGARLRYDEVIRRYPGSAAASVAEERRKGT